MLLAAVQDSIGELVTSNQVVYPNAFDALKADVRYTYTKAGFEQDVILREQPPDPKEYGLAPETTVLEVMTEFLDPPSPRRKADGTVVGVNESGRPRFSAATLDESLDFGEMRIGDGVAFSLEDQAGSQQEAPVDRRGLAVRKSWQKIESRDVLIESFGYTEALPELGKLPARDDARAAASAPRRMVRNGRQIPGRGSKEEVARSRGGRIEVAASTVARPGFVVDYSILGNASDFIFKGDTTYLVTGTVTLSGTTTLEGGAIIKYDPYVAGNSLQVVITGPFRCATDRYLPAFFVAKDDNGVGEVIAGSTGSPSGPYGYSALWFANGRANVIQHVRFRNNHISCGFSYAETGTVVRHAQFVGSYAPVFSYSALSLQNCLFRACTFSIRSDGSINVVAEHVTVMNSQYAPYTGGSATFSLTNCMLSSVATVGSYSGANNVTDPGGSGLQTVGGGAAYLKTYSSHRNAGTTNISGDLRQDLKLLTTFPPLFFTNSVTTSTALAPIVPLDTDAPDIGYHYDPIDYLVTGVTISNAVLLLTNGVALATYGNSIGIDVRGGGTLLSEGTASALNRIARSQCVQEATYGTDPSGYYQVYSSSASLPIPQVRLRFTRFTGYPTAAASVHAGYNYQSTQILDIRDCQFYCAQIYGHDLGVETAVVSAVNNLFERSHVVIGGAAVDVRNNTLIGASLLLLCTSGETYTVTDNLFDKVTVSNWTGGARNFGTNAYVTNYSQLSPAGSGNVILSASPSYQSGPYGWRYSPVDAPLVNAGSRSAAAAGLHHHTTQVSQVKDASTTVDIGFHYVAANWASPDWVWIEDSLPSGSSTGVELDSWTWIGSNPAPYSGSLAHQSDLYSGQHQHYFSWCPQNFIPSANDVLFTYIFVDPANPPQEVMLQWFAQDATWWDHRAYWGADLMAVGYPRTAMGALPATGTWVRLEVPAASVDLVGRTVSGMSYTLYGGRATWDRSGRTTTGVGIAPKPMDSEDFKPKANLVGQWLLDEGGANTAFDASGYANHGTLKNGAYHAQGKVGTAVICDGVNDYVDIGNPTPLNQDLGALSIAFWMYANAIPATSDARLVGKGTICFGTTYHTDGKVWFYIRDGGNNVKASVGTGGWHHVVGTFDGAALRLYVDGALAATKSPSNYGTTGTGGTFSMGGPTSYFNGRLDEVLVYSRCLSANEVQILYDTSPQPVGDGLADYLEDRNGNGVLDSGETLWQDSADQGLKVNLTRPKATAALP